MTGRTAAITLRLALAGVCVVLAGVAFGTLRAQAPAGVGARPSTARQAAPVDLTGPWVAVVSEDWQWRMVTPPRGDMQSVPLNEDGRRVAQAWDVSRDGLCEAYGVGGIMRMPTRLRISWQDDQTLRIDTDAGRQTRLIRFGNVPPPRGARTLQGHSLGEWLGGGAGNVDVFTGQGDGPGRQQWGSLRVQTTHVRAGWLRRNGVPYSQHATITEHFTRIAHPVAGDWFVVTTTVDDPTYLTTPFITSSNFRKEPDDSTWHPTSCRS